MRSWSHLKDNFESIPEFTEDELFNLEKEIIGFMINKNPLIKYQKIIETKATKKIGYIDNKDLNKDLYVEGEADYLDKLKISGLKKSLNA